MVTMLPVGNDLSYIITIVKSLIYEYNLITNRDSNGRKK